MKIADDFVFGVSTSAYQIEGSAMSGGRGTSIWDRFCRLDGAVRNGDTGDVACDHYRRYETDLDLLVQLGVGAYRFSVAWPRVLPTGRGQLNTVGLDFYDRLVDELLERHIQPWLCLYHWDLPQDLQDLGGWRNRDIIHWFTDYAGKVSARLGDRCRHIALFNEPNIAAILGYSIGIHAPGIRDRRQSAAALHHFNLATTMAAAALRTLRPETEIGTILALNDVQPARDEPEDLQAAQRVRDYWYDSVLDPILGRGYPSSLETEVEPFIADDDLVALSTTDLAFLGVNYYTTERAKNAPERHPMQARRTRPRADEETTAMGWRVQPEGLRNVLSRVSEKAPELGLFVTENGAAYSDSVMRGAIHDRERIHFLRRHVAAALEAKDRGVDLRGYFAWTLLDNFEWAEGYSKRFGLVHVDLVTQKRTPKSSFQWYRELIEHRELDI